MSMATSPSDQLVRAVGKDIGRIDVERQRIQKRLDSLGREQKALRGHLRELQRYEHALKIIAGDASGSVGEPGKVVVRGAQLREEAVRLLWNVQGTQPTHHRVWFDLFSDAGFVVLCASARPLATFLTAVSRAALVCRAADAGVYYIDPAVVVAVRQELAEVRAELADLDSVLADEANPSEDLRKHRMGLLASMRRLDRTVLECERCLVGPSV